MPPCSPPPALPPARFVDLLRFATVLCRLRLAAPGFALCRRLLRLCPCCPEGSAGSPTSRSARAGSGRFVTVDLVEFSGRGQRFLRPFSFSSFLRWRAPRFGAGGCRHRGRAPFPRPFCLELPEEVSEPTPTTAAIATTGTRASAHQSRSTLDGARVPVLATRPQEPGGVADGALVPGRSRPRPAPGSRARSPGGRSVPACRQAGGRGQTARDRGEAKKLTEATKSDDRHRDHHDTGRRRRAGRGSRAGRRGPGRQRRGDAAGRRGDGGRRSRASAAARSPRSAAVRAVGERPGTGQVDDVTRVGAQPSPHTIDGTKRDGRPRGGRTQ